MVFLLIIPPVSSLGEETTYFWLLQKWLYSFKNEISVVIMPESYKYGFDDLNRWEFSDWSCNFHQYRISDKIGSNTHFLCYPKIDVLNNLESSPFSLFFNLINEDISELTEFYIRQLLSVKETYGSEVVVVSWLNIPSLRVAAIETDCQLIFNELGPLRKPYYHQTAYWDRYGVNAETQVPLLWSHEKAAFTEWMRREFPSNPLGMMREILCAPKVRGQVTFGRERFSVGLALQVETDSNAIAFRV